MIQGLPKNQAAFVRQVIGTTMLINRIRPRPVDGHDISEIVSMVKGIKPQNGSLMADITPIFRMATMNADIMATLHLQEFALALGAVLIVGSENLNKHPPNDLKFDVIFNKKGIGAQLGFPRLDLLVSTVTGGVTRTTKLLLRHPRGSVCPWHINHSSLAEAYLRFAGTYFGAELLQQMPATAAESPWLRLLVLGLAGMTVGKLGGVSQNYNSLGKGEKMLLTIEEDK